MRRTRWTTLLACYTVTAVLAWTVLDLVLRHRGWTPILTAWTSVLALLLGGVVLTYGLAVRRLRSRQRTWITPAGAAVTAAAAQASSVVGSLLSGAYTGQLVLALAGRGSPLMVSAAWTAGTCLLACAVWTGIGLLVEHWCAIDLTDDDDGDDPARSIPRDGAPA